MSSLRVTNVDLQRTKNTTDHRTKDYVTNALVLRRAQPFKIVTTLSRAVQPGEELKIICETGVSPSLQKNTKAEMPLSSSSTGTSWRAVRGPSSSTNILNITITSPDNAVIGKYKMNLQVTSGGRSNVLSLGSFILVFNPWAPGDQVYMSIEEERVEYNLNERGLYWVGSWNRYFQYQWDYAQFDTDILSITLDLLNKSPEYIKDPATDVSRRGDVIYVSRMLSALVNSNDESGVLVGNWTGNYRDGVSPGTWNSSGTILRQWKKSGPVKYGQCWVFAGVLCTVLRTLGIPARLIINFLSAHDTDINLRIDHYVDEYGTELDESSDSVWNFHAWTEAYMTRYDLGKDWNGWQVVDATPQERSDGTFCMGPTSKTAVKEGDVNLLYDTKFAFAEVNAVESWWRLNKDGPNDLIYSNNASVGRNISTKAVGLLERRDITSEYKYPDDSPKEKEIFDKAVKLLNPPRLGAMRTAAFAARLADNEAQPESAPPKPVKPEFSASFKDADTTQVGEDLVCALILQNLLPKPQEIKISTTSTSVIYNNKPVKDILTESQSVKLGPNEEKSILVTLPYKAYRDKITADNMIQHTAVCEDEKGGTLLTKMVTKLKNPKLLIRVMDDAIVGKTSQIDVIFSNPLNEDVPESVFIAEGSGLMDCQAIATVPPLKKNQRVTMQFDFCPYKDGDRGLYVDFNSDVFKNTKGFQTVTVRSQDSHNTAKGEKKNHS